MTQPAGTDPTVTAAEQAIIGAALQAPLTTVLLDPDCFADTRHAHIWSLISARVDEHEPVSEILIAHDLSKTGMLARLPGGAAYLHTCLTTCPSPSHAPHYAKIITEAWEARTLHAAAERLRNAAGLSDSDQRRKLAQEALQRAHDVLTPRSENGAAGRVRFTALSTIGVRAARWTWDRRLPAGAITLLAGKEGIGKSTSSAWLAARITRGELPGEHHGTPRAVAVVATEDAYAEVIAPRMIAAGADISRVYRADLDDESPIISVPADLPGLTHLCQEHQVALVIVDPIMSVIQASLDSHKDHDVRQALTPLAAFAQATNAAIVGLIHVNKSATTDPLNSIMASKAFTAVARSVLYCVVDPTAEHEDRYLLGHPKSNLGPKQPTLSYHLIEATIEALDPDGTPITATTSRVIFDGEDSRSIRDVLEAGHGTRVASEPAQAITDWITNQGRPVTTAEIVAEFSPDMKAATVRQHLTRLVKRDILTQPVYGHYAPVLKTVTPVTHTTVVTPVTGVTDSVTGVTSVTVLQAPEILSHLPVTPALNRENVFSGVQHVDTASEKQVAPAESWGERRCVRGCGTVMKEGDTELVCRYCLDSQ